MAELFERIDSVSDTPVSDRVNQLSRSNKDRSEQNFAEALKKKLKDAQDEQENKDELILDTDGDRDSDEPQDETKDESSQQAKPGPDEESSEHIDIKA